MISKKRKEKQKRKNLKRQDALFKYITKKEVNMSTPIIKGEVMNKEPKKDATHQNKFNYIM